MDNLSVFSVADTADFVERLPAREFHRRVIELAARHEVDVLAGHKAFRGLHLDGRANESDFEVRFGLFHSSHQP